MMSAKKPAFLFVHGAWHNAATWRLIIPLLEARGYTAVALDLPGAGVNARMPRAYYERPLDPAAFATEPSPNAGVTQEERTAAVVALIEKLGGDVVLVGHSLGGITISAVAEAVGERLRAVVYLTAFMLPPGMPAIAMIQHETTASALVASLFLADPAVAGALRIDPRAKDAGYRVRLKAAFYADLTDAEFERAAAELHCDEPAGVTMNPSPVSAARFGRVARHYIRCLEDRALPIAGQDFMIAAMDAAIGGKTETHSLGSSHSPFISQPVPLADILIDIASRSNH